jgi:type III secretion control protein HpaP
VSRLVRIIAPLLPEQNETTPSARLRPRRVDYAALMRRTRVAAIEQEHVDTRRDEQQEQPDAPERPLAARIGAVCAPSVDAAYRQQEPFIALIGRVAREVTAFCAHRAITQSGNWEVRMPLDPRILPETTLYLTLSPHCLQLRFDTQDASSRQLLLQHGQMLDRELSALLDAWGEPREVDIAIW